MDKSIFSNFNIKSSLKYRLMFIAGGLLHTVFFIFFVVKGFVPLAFFNIISIFMYALGSVLGVDKKNGTMRYGWMIAFYVEILVHSVMCTLLIGVESGFQLYALAVLPLAIYVLFFSCAIEKFLITMGAFIVCCIVTLVTSVIVVEDSEYLPYYPLTYGEIHTFRSLNMIFAGALLITFSMMFALEMHGLLRRINETNQRLEYTATHDALTGLYNRHSLKPLIEELRETDEQYCVALGDIDNFKKVNDTYGHDCGDLVLKKVASLISEGIGGRDTACRWGGEELLIVFRGTKLSAYEKLNDILNGIRASEVQSGDKTVTVTMTFGFVERESGLDIEELISLADGLLYKGKSSGKNKIVCKEDM